MVVVVSVFGQYATAEVCASIKLSKVLLGSFVGEKVGGLTIEFFLTVVTRFRLRFVDEEKPAAQ